MRLDCQASHGPFTARTHLEQLAKRIGLDCGPLVLHVKVAKLEVTDAVQFGRDVDNASGVALKKQRHETACQQDGAEKVCLRGVTQVLLNKRGLDDKQL